MDPLDQLRQSIGANNVQQDNYRCGGCGNELPALELCTILDGSDGYVCVWPGSVMCGCGMRMRYVPGRSG